MKCPLCDSDNAVKTADKGFKRKWRAVIGNRRYLCEACRITWRQKEPQEWLKIRITGTPGETPGGK